MARVKTQKATAVRNADNSVTMHIDLGQAMKRSSKLPTVGEAFHSAEARLVNSDWTDPSFFGNSYKGIGNPEDIRKDIEQAVIYHFNDPLVGKVIELMVIFSNDTFINECNDQKIKDWYDAFCFKLNMDQILSQQFLEYFRSSNVVTARALDTYEPDDKRMKGGKLLPSAYTVLNPLDIYPQGNGPKADLYLNVDKNPEFMSALKEEVGLAAQLFDLKAGKQMKNDKGVKLNPENVKRILRMCQPYEPMARPMMKRAFQDLYLKAKMKEMDLSTVNGVINQIIKVTIGDKDHVATANKIAAAAKIFKNPTKTLTVVWDHTLNIEVVKPGDPKWLDKGKYEEVNENIRSAFGISQVLSGTGADGLSGNNAYLSVKGFLGNLIEGRKAILWWLYNEYRYIAKQMNFSEVPVPKFRPLALGDEIREKQTLGVLVDNGILSRRSAQETLGYDPETEMKRLKEETKLVNAGELPGKPGGAGGAGGRPLGDSGKTYPPDRKPSAQKRLKGKATVSVTGDELHMKGITNGEQIINYLKEKIDLEVEEIQGT